jgi:hypothetical protein
MLEQVGYDEDAIFATESAGKIRGKGGRVMSSYLSVFIHSCYMVVCCDEVLFVFVLLLCLCVCVCVYV